MWRFDADTDPGIWVSVDSPTDVTLRDLTSSVNGPVAVGDKGVAIGRGRERWGVILENGPGAKGRPLHAVDTSDDGKRVWFAGAGGAFGYYDIVSETRRDYSVPRGNANRFHALAVAGERGSEKFLLGDGSGNVLPGHMENDETDWSWTTTPSSGNAVQALTHDAEGFGYGVTANGNVFMTTEDDKWERVGIDGAETSFYACSFADGVFLTGGGGGVVYEADKLLDHDDDVVWTPTALGGFAVHGTDAGNGAQLACGEGGNIYVRMAGGDWQRGMYDDSTTFHAGLVDEQMVAVGGNGLIVERRCIDEVPPEVLRRYDDSLLDGDEGGNYVGREPGRFTGGEEIETVTICETAGGGDDSRDTDGSGDENTDTGSPDGTDWTGDGGGSGDIDWTDDPDGSGDTSGPGSPGGGGGSGDGGGSDGTDSSDSGGWENERSHDGDPFDGHGELHDGDGNEPVGFEESEHSGVVTDTRGTAEAGETGTDPADEPDGESGDSGNDPPDEPDSADNDLPDEPDPEDNDPPDEPDGLQNDVPGDPGNDEPDAPDPNTDSDADSPDS